MRWSLRPLVLWLALGWLALGLLGCEPDPPLVFAVVPWIGNAPLYLARDRRLVPGVELRIVPVSTDFDTWRAMLDERADGVVCTLFDVQRGLDLGVDVRVVAAVDFSNGADGVAAREEIASVGDLRGRRVAVEVGTITHFVLLQALARASLHEPDVTLVNMPMKDAQAALKEGRIDAGAFWEPLLSEAATRPQHVVFTSTEIPGEIVDVLVLREKVLRHRPEAAVRLLQAYEAGLGALRQGRDAAVSEVARSMGDSEDNIHRSLRTVELMDLESGLPLFDAGSGERSLARAYERATEFMTGHKQLRRPPPPASEVLDDRFLRRALPGGR